MLEASFPILTRPMATSSETMAPLPFVGCLTLFVIVERRGSHGVAAVGKDCAEGSGRWTSVHLGVTRLDSFGEKVVTIEFAIAVFKGASVDQLISASAALIPAAQAIRFSRQPDDRFHGHSSPSQSFTHGTIPYFILAPTPDCHLSPDDASL